MRGKVEKEKGRYDTKLPKGVDKEEDGRTEENGRGKEGQKGRRKRGTAICKFTV